MEAPRPRGSRAVPRRQQDHQRRRQATRGRVAARAAVPAVRPARPDAIWPFAWDVARRHIADESEIGLVINPDDARTQNQMHVHMLRLDRGARALLDSLDPPSDGTWLRAPAALVLPLPNLEHVFSTAADRIGSDAIGTHGILVARAKGAGYLAVLTARISPQVLTKSHC